MTLPLPSIERVHTHTRKLRYEGYRRADGRFDIEAHLTDVKNHDTDMKTGVRRAGQPIHEMWIRLTIDRQMTIVEACASSDAVPYPGGCEAVAPAYAALEGSNLMRGFRKRVKELFGGVQGCTHLSEMLGGMPTAAIQTFAGELPEDGHGGEKPFQLDQCQALDTRSETVRKWYPKWYRRGEKVGG